MSDAGPSEQELSAYLRGTLPTQRFEAIDAWLATQDEATVSRLLEAAAPEEDRRPLSAGEAEPETDHYRSATRQRFQPQAHLAAGGMGAIEAVHDAILDRDVVLKRCLPRAPEEPIAGHLDRQRLFRREALITAQLEHPAVIPVHDFGSDEFGEPTMVLKRLDGEDLARYATERRGNSHWAITEGMDIALRICEALAYAHAAGVVHRDLKPANLIIGAYGTVTVIDWGLAAANSEAPSLSTAVTVNASDGSLAGAYCYGTPAWMAPEQADGGAADPRMDVWALGGLLNFLFTGQEPRRIPAGAAATQLAATIRQAVTTDEPGDSRGMPRSLQAVARRCLAQDPAQRYADAGEVLAELRRWRALGITEAQRPGLASRGLGFIRRHRLPVALAAAISVSLLLVIIVQIAQHRSYQAFAEASVDQLLAETPVLDADAVAAALGQLRNLRKQYGRLPTIVRAEQHFDSVAEDLDRQRRLDRIAADLQAVDALARIDGPSPAQIAARQAVADAAGIDWRSPAAAAQLADHPLGEELLANLAALDVLLVLADRAHGRHDHSRHTQIRQILRQVPSAGPWASLAMVLDAAHVQPHDLHIPTSAREALDDVLSHAPSADVLLPITAPDDALIAYARSRLARAPSAFWPRMLLARHELTAGRLAAAKDSALIALGREESSNLPHLLLAYVALLRDDTAGLNEQLTILQQRIPDQVEVPVLQAAGCVRTGAIDEAQRIIDATEAWNHYRLHDHTHAQHPMDLSLEILRQSGVRLLPPD